MFYLAEIKWHPDEYFYHPEMVFWLRNSVQRAQWGVTAGNFALCSGPAVPPGGIAVGEAGFALTPGRKASLKSALSLGEDIVADDVNGFVEELVVNLADPTGVSRWKPIRVKSGRRLKFKLGDVEVNRRVRATDPEWRQTLAVERISYAGWRLEAQAAASALVASGRTWEQVRTHQRDRTIDQVDRDLLRLGAPNKHLKALDYLTQKYGVPYRDFQASLPDEAPEPHESSFSEDFVGADKAGVGYQLTWTEYVGTGWENLSNNAADNTAHGAANQGARADSDLATDDHECQATLVSYTEVSGNQRTGVQVRKDSTTTDTHYCFLAAMNNNNWQIWEITGGGDAQLATGGGNPAAGNVLKGRVDGSDLTLYVGGVSTVTFTDASITGNLRCGLFAQSNDAGDLQSWGTWSAADLAAATFDLDRIERRTMRGHLRGVMRGT